MTDSYLLIPGTGGITLLDSEGNDLGYPGKMQIGVRTGGLLFMSADELVELLSMLHAPGQLAPVRTSLRTGLSIRPGHVIRAAYNQVPSSFNTFLYDWRSDLMYSAGQLHDYLLERRPPGGRWRLVGHSQGALLAVLASKLFPRPDDYARTVASTVLVGAPLAGTVNAARALVNGDLMGRAGEAAFQAIVRTWPAVYEMLPSWPACLDANGATTSLLDPSAWTGLVGISSDLLARVATVQSALRDPLACMEGDVDVAIIMARNRPTGVNLERPHGTLTGTSHDFGLGDSLVAVDRTREWLGRPLAPYVKLIEGNVREHAYLFDDPTAIGVVRQALG